MRPARPAVHPNPGRRRCSYPRTRRRSRAALPVGAAAPAPIAAAAAAATPPVPSRNHATSAPEFWRGLIPAPVPIPGRPTHTGGETRATRGRRRCRWCGAGAALAAAAGEVPGAVPGAAPATPATVGAVPATGNTGGAGTGTPATERQAAAEWQQAQPVRQRRHRRARSRRWPRRRIAPGSGQEDADFLDVERQVEQLPAERSTETPQPGLCTKSVPNC